MPPSSPRREDQAWKRQAALFAAGASALIGIGTVISVLMLARPPAPKAPLPPASPSPAAASNR